MKELIEAVNKVMSSVENVDKSMTIGSGQNAYKGVSDKDVKLLFNKAMRDNGLAIFTTKIEPTTTVERWEAVDPWSKSTPKDVKMYQSVFTEVLVTYELHHVSGQSIQLQGYGQGIDPQDKSAGKATTYALKYTLLYNFLVATGHIDDTDSTHSDSIPTQQTKATPKSDTKWLNPKTPEWDAAIKFLADGGAMSDIKKKYAISKANETLLIDEVLG